MQSAISMQLLKLLMDHANAGKPLAQPILDKANDTYSIILDSYLAGASSISFSAKQRRALADQAGIKVGPGRPVSTYYAVTLGSLTDDYVLGLERAQMLVAEILDKYQGGRVPTKNSMKTTISGQGRWTRNLETFDGQHVLDVHKVAGVQPTPEEAERLETWWHTRAPYNA